jgi:hypothetical protein
MDSNEQVRTADFATAKQMLDGWIKDRNAGLIGLALGHPSLILRRQAADALGQIGDTAAVPPLIVALKQNQVVYGGGSEEKALQVELNGALSASLRALTEADFGTIDPTSKDDMRRVLEVSRQWWEKSQG